MQLTTVPLNGSIKAFRGLRVLLFLRGFEVQGVKGHLSLDVRLRLGVPGSEFTKAFKSCVIFSDAFCSSADSITAVYKGFKTGLARMI